MEVVGHPIGLFPAIDFSDSEWKFRIAHYGHMLGDSAEETLRGTIRFMNGSITIRSYYTTVWVS
jgi:hypothetical protein